MAVDKEPARPAEEPDPVPGDRAERPAPTPPVPAPQPVDTPDPGTGGSGSGGGGQPPARGGGSGGGGQPPDRGNGGDGDGGNGNGGNGGNGGEGDVWPTVPVRLFREHPWLLIAIFAAIVVLLIGLAAWLPFPAVGDQPEGEAPTIEPTNALVGAYLVRWGIALVIVAFIAQLFMLIASSLQLEAKEEEQLRMAAATPADLVTALAAALPGLIKVPAGIGVSLALIGAVLLLGTAVALGPEPSPTPTASAEAEPTGSPGLTDAAQPSPTE